MDEGTIFVSYDSSNYSIRQRLSPFKPRPEVRHNEGQQPAVGQRGPGRRPEFNRPNFRDWPKGDSDVRVADGERDELPFRNEGQL